MYIVWRDHCSTPQARTAEDLPSSIGLEGVAWFIDETETDVRVAAYRCSDGGWTEVVAIAKRAIDTMYPIQWPQRALRIEQLYVAKPGEEPDPPCQ